MSEQGDNVAIVIMQSGRVELTGAKISHGSVMDAREALLQYVRAQVIAPQIPQQSPEATATEPEKGEGEALQTYS